MSWAREIFAELRREEAQRELEEDLWYSCEEGSDGDEAWEAEDARAPIRDDEKISTGFVQRGGWSGATELTDSSIFEQSGLRSTRGGLAVPAERTGVSTARWSVLYHVLFSNSFY